MATAKPRRSIDCGEAPLPKIEAIILAGGKGVRMGSTRPKALQLIGGKPMLAHILLSVRKAGINRMHIVHGESACEALKAVAPDSDINWVLQKSPLGTAHAVIQALPHVENDSVAVVLYSDNPFVSSETMVNLGKAAEHGRLALLTGHLDDPTGFGRVLRTGEGQVAGVVEHKDATGQQLNISEVNIGPIAARSESLKDWLLQIGSANSQSEYYLTDVVQIALDSGAKVETCAPSSPIEVSGVNSRTEQVALERMHQRENAERLMESGVFIADPNRFDLRGSCSAGKDCSIDVNVVLEGDVVLHDAVLIGPNCIIRDSLLRSNVTVEANCVVEGAVIHQGATIGPFARIRPGSTVGEQSRIGNFVEINRSSLGNRTKASHLSYIGDSAVGDEVNVGAGVITCNYDGEKKHRTVIGDRSFIGSNAALVAPIEIGKDAVVGAGSTLTRSVENGQMAVERSKMRAFPVDRLRKNRPSG